MRLFMLCGAYIHAYIMSPIQKKTLCDPAILNIFLRWQVLVILQIQHLVATYLVSIG